MSASFKKSQSVFDWRLRRQLDKAANRLWHERFLQLASVVWVLLAAAAVVFWLQADRFGWSLPGKQFTLITVAVVALIVICVAAYRRTRDQRFVASRVEASFPELDSVLLTAVDARPLNENGQLGYLQDRVVGQALSHAYQSGWQGVVPLNRLASMHVVHAMALAAFCGAAYLLATADTSGSLAGNPDAASIVGLSAQKFTVVIEPGNTEVERGSSLLVMARFQGLLPPEATLVVNRAEAAASSKGGTEKEQDSAKAGASKREQTETRIKMSKALDDPLFGGSVPNVTGELTYRVEYAAQKSESFRVTVFEFPRLVKADAQLIFPDYTRMAEKRVEDVRRISAVQGTRVVLTCQLNKQVATAKLVEKDDTFLGLKPNEGAKSEYSVEFVLDRTRRCELKLVDVQGRENKETVEFVFTALPNNPPDLKLAAPGRDVDVSPLEELDLKAKVFDDFGLNRVGVSFAMAGKDEKELVLASNISGKERVDVGQLMALETLNAQPDELLSYYFWAEDTGPDGQVRRVSSDMYFAEVRPFDEIFRQRQQPAGGQQQQGSGAGQGNAAQAEGLAQAQKDIMNATWKVIRRETGERPTDAFEKDASLVHESQSELLTRAEELAEEIQDPQSKKHVQSVLENMKKAVEHLTKAKDGPAISELRPALEAEQSAYQSLLRLRAREHQVIRGQQSSSSSSSSSSSRSQQQLQQLDLKDRENRYETERTAQPQETESEREMRQVLNRLKELARRQDDLNDRLKELQAELEQAASEEQREELRRQLKRLQEEQEQILRDTDELQARMDQPENSERMADASQQLNDARERTRQSSEALKEGMVPQAVSAGTRAQENFEQLRDEFRQQTSEHFRSMMRELQQEAKQLEEREQQLAEGLKELSNPSERPTSLRDANEREQIASGLQDQQQQTEKLLQRMRETIEQAEQPQPVLAEQLYDTVRQAQQRDLGRGLDMTRQLVTRGFDEQARQLEEPIGQAIREIRQGVDRAAESVLGDETEALRRAQSQLENLNEQVQQELREQGLANSNDDAQRQASSNGPNEGEPQDRGAESSRRESEQPGQNPKAREGASKGERSEKSDAGSSKGKGKQRGTGEQKGDSENEAQQEENAQREGTEKSDSQPSNSEKGKGGNSKSGQRSGDPSSEKGGSAGQPQRREGENGQPGGGSPQDQGQPSDQSQPGQPSEQPGQGQGSASAGSQSENARGDRTPSGFDQLTNRRGGGGNEELLQPFTGRGFREWSDRLRDVEEILSDPDLSAEAARIRERARALRAESQRHSAPPNWDLVKLQVAEPLTELLNRVSEELLKRSGQKTLVPIDRDPVPPEYTEQVRKYFERLGEGK